MAHECQQCGAKEGDDHRINCYFEGTTVKSPLKVVEEILEPYFIRGDMGGESDYVAAKIVEELGL